MDGLEIRHWRAANRIKQDALAEMLGVSRVAVSKWESGQCRPSKTTALRLADVMGGLHVGAVAREIAMLAPLGQVKALVRGRSLRLSGLSAGFRALWPETGALLGKETRPFLINEAAAYAGSSNFLSDALRGDVLMVTAVSNRLMDAGEDVPVTDRIRWHAIARKIEGELFHEIIYEPCAAATPTGFEAVLRRADIAGFFA
jgi:transcriptional regulator with XRE-family HTH domain